MKESIFKQLVCAVCHGDLQLEAFVQDDDKEVIEGVVHCGCGERYPVIGGVPRMLPRHLRDDLPKDYPEFYARYRDHFDEAPIVKDADALVQRHTQEAFGYEWTWAGDYHAENYADWFPQGIDPAELVKGRTGLEVGCGAGRHAQITASRAAEHFAVDLSRAVDSAFERNRHTTNCHVVQADAFHLPFRPGSFDYVYCLGVLQHMHDPVAGFRHLAKQPKKGGALLVNVYQASRPFVLGALELFRKLTTRMSNRSLGRLSWALGVVDYAFIWPWKILKQTPLEKVLKPMVPGRVDEYARHDFHTCVTDWFDRLSCPVKKHYTREQMLSWYVEEGYDQIVVTPYWKAFWNGYGLRRADA